MRISTVLFRSTRRRVVALAAGAIVLGGAVRAGAQDHPAHAAPPPAAAAPKLFVEGPVPPLLAQGLVVLLARAENLQILPVYGAAALGVVPRLGHLHVKVDGGAWHWVHASADPIVIQGLAPGKHRVRLDLADPTHKVIESRTVEFDIK